MEDRLQLVYITACDGGRNAAGWRAALAPAEVTTFDRLSAVLEHVWLLWLVAPGKVRGLPDPPTATNTMPLSCGHCAAAAEAIL